MHISLKDFKNTRKQLQYIHFRTLACTLNCKNWILILYYLFFGSSFIQSQENDVHPVPDSLQNILQEEFKIPDSLKSMSYVTLEDKFYNHFNETTIAKVYANTIYHKGKKERDSLTLANGLYLLSKIGTSEQRMVYANELIRISKHLKSDQFPGKAYESKARVYIKASKYSEALNYYLKADSLYAKFNDTKARQRINSRIGYLRIDLGDYKGALTSFKKYYAYLKKNYPNDSIYLKSHLKILYSLSDIYNRLNMSDSASIMDKKASKLYYKSKKNYSDYCQLVLISGETLFYQKKYKQSRDSINAAIKGLIKKGDLENLKMAHLLLGKGYQEQGNIKKAVTHFNVIDSLILQNKSVFPDLRAPYEVLIDYYKDQDDREKQLYYMKRLIEIDKVLDASYKNVSHGVSKNYDIPNLIKSKEVLINKIEEEKNTSSIFNWILGFLLSIASLIVFIFYHKQKKYKSKIEQYRKSRAKVSDKNSLMLTHNSISKEVPDTITQGILKNLNEFERNKGFLKKNLTQKSIAISIDTNSSYLSKIVNQYKGKNFATYLNELRVDHAIDRLEKDPKFKKYTVKAIAEEVGFNTAESFSKAFEKRTGFKPSFFIKNISKITKS